MPWSSDNDMNSDARASCCKGRRMARILLWPVCCLLLLQACAPIAYRDPSGASLASPPPGPRQVALLTELRTALQEYGTPVPMRDAPGFIVNSPDYTLTARLAGEHNLDLGVYWAPGNFSKHNLPLLIADIRSRMAEALAEGYSLQAKQ